MGPGRAADIFLKPPTLKAESTDPIFTVLKYLNLLKKDSKKQKASYNFKLGFALLNRPHFNSVYLVRVPFLTGIAVCWDRSLTSRNFPLGLKDIYVKTCISA